MEAKKSVETFSMGGNKQNSQKKQMRIKIYNKKQKQMQQYTTNSFL